VNLDIRFNFTGVNWEIVSETLKRVGMTYDKPAAHRKAFENSYVTVFIYKDNQFIGFGRSISDGVFQAAVYDIAVIPEFQKMGAGSIIIKSILARLPKCNIILYANPGKEEFYEKLGFRKMKTGMAYFRKTEEMKEKGFTE
jgi:ribosomal protein S18 acetylase RimI-like enzyme